MPRGYVKPCDIYAGKDFLREHQLAKFTDTFLINYRALISYSSIRALCMSNSFLIVTNNRDADNSIVYPFYK